VTGAKRMTALPVIATQEKAKTNAAEKEGFKLQAVSKKNKRQLQLIT
jgi:hypothetical protein